MIKLHLKFPYKFWQMPQVRGKVTSLAADFPTLMKITKTGESSSQNGHVPNLKILKRNIQQQILNSPQ